MAKKKFVSLDESMLKAEIDLPSKSQEERHFGLTVKLPPSLYRRLVSAKLDVRGSTHQSIMVQALEEWLERKSM